MLGKHLSILELGEQSATSLGVNTDKTRIMLIVSSVCMIALATATTGPIAFVSFLSGPIAKRLVGVGFSNVIPAGLVGVNLVLAADLIGQFAFVARYPCGHHNWNTRSTISDLLANPNESKGRIIMKPTHIFQAEANSSGL